MGISIIIVHENREVMDTDYFVERLKTQWPEVQIHFTEVPNAPVLQFSTPDDFWILGRFSGTGVSYKGYSRIEDVYFALWYHSIVPAQCELRVYDSALTFDLMFLTSETTVEQMMEGFNIAFDAKKYL